MTESVSTGRSDARIDRVQLRNAVLREQQQASQAARERAQADFERALQRIEQRDEAPPGNRAARAPASNREPAQAGALPMARAGAEAASAADARGPAAGAAAPGPDAIGRAGAQGAAFGRPPGEASAPAGAAGPAQDAAGARLPSTARPDAPAIEAAAATAASAATEALVCFSPLSAPGAAPAASASPDAPAARPDFTPHALAAHLQHLQAPIAQDGAGLWRFELADASLPVREVVLARGADGGVRVALQASSGTAADAQASLAAPLERLRERLAERGTQVDAVNLHDPRDDDLQERA